MVKGALYNEIDPKAAAWIRELIKQGHVAPGDVAECSIEDLTPNDIRPYTQFHAFAGIAVWSYALRRAGWDDSRSAWTMSCPCQPFSAAGKGAGFADERHLWPYAQYLIEQCRPAIVFGEQVASKDAEPWIDLVQDDLEAVGYAVGAVPFPSAGVGAPHIRDRLYWVADATDAGREWRRSGEARDGSRTPRSEPQRLRDAQQLVDPELQRRRLGQPRSEDATDAPVTGETRGLANAHGGHPGAERQPRGGEQRQQPQDSGAGSMADPGGVRRLGREGLPAGCVDDGEDAGRIEDHDGPVSVSEAGDARSAPGPTNGLWRDADWLLCRDGKWRPVEPRPQPMVDGSTRSLGPVLPGLLQDLEFEVAEWAVRHQADPGKAMHDLWQTLSSRAQREWPIGGLPDLHGAPVLLAFLRQLEAQGWAFPEGVSFAGEETTKERLRVLRLAGETAGASRRRGLDEQQPDEPADPMHLLSSILARYAQAAWGEAHASYASTGFPLARGARSRVARLRGYGNAINAEAAVAWIESYLDARADLDGRFRVTEQTASVFD